MPNIAHDTGAGRMSVAASLRSIRRQILPKHLDDLGWAPVWSLLYLGFLFMTWDEVTVNWLRPTLVSLAIFLPLYFRCYWLTGWKQLAHVAVCAANTAHREKRLRQAELKLSHDEIRRLAALAERERIGRDLHDLLGHTLSLITLKSELAMRLFDRDPLAARREIVDVERVARDTLGQVRRAVAGIRAAGLAAELASAHLLLESGGVRLDYEAPDDATLPADVETIFALTLREAVTNIQRHARATYAQVTLAVAASEARLTIEDNGCGGVISPGNGLTGMRERLRALGGDLAIVAGNGRGTRLEAHVELTPGSKGVVRLRGQEGLVGD
jgi:two-component system sensor histidine kinase DesK